MYEIICNILGLSIEVGSTAYDAVIFACLALIIILTAVFIDMIYRVFSHFWHG